MQHAGRLTSPADFRRTYASGRKASSPTVVVHALQTGEARPARIGVSVARGVGGSVERNRAKRRLREAVRPLRATLRDGVDAIFVATGAARVAPFQRLADNAQSSAGKAGALRE